MGLPGWTQILLVVLLVVVLFGRGKISDLMGDVAKGIRSFKDGLKEPPELEATDNTAPEVIVDASQSAETVADKEKVS
ncbi:MAG: twin-arginine translocase TatA/TatE family subunit [Pseudomonadota bacterium]